MEPLRVTAGDTWTWVRAVSDYPASAGWTLKYFFALAAAEPKVVTCEADGDAYQATVAAADSGEWTPGDYRWTARVTKGDEVYTVGTGTLVVAPDPTSAVDRRTPEELALAAVNAVLAGRLADPIVEYEIDGVRAKKIPPDQLLALKAKLAGAVRRQRGGPAAVPILVRFGRV